MFVYLDHAHFAALDVMLRRDPAGFGDFLGFWLENQCKLVVSRAHLHEIGQSIDERDVEKRLEVLRYFSIWSGDKAENVDWVVIREIHHQTLHRLGPENEGTSEPYSSIREELYRPAEHSNLQDFVRQSRLGWLEDLRFRHEFAAFENRGVSLRKKLRKVTKKKEPGWDPEGWRMLPLVESIAPTASGDPVADRWLAAVKSRTRECWQRAKRKRQMLVCMYDLDGLAAVARAPEQDLSRLGFYRALARHWVRPYCRLAKHDPVAIEAALDSFDPYDAPAISASLAVERGRKTHEKAFEAGDYMDADHVLWAAYADLAFIDKRTHGFLLQARRTPTTARLLSPHLKVRFERAATLDDVKRHIIARAEERSRDTGTS
jgi:hypothetical protein